MANKIIFLPKWYDELINDKYEPFTAEEISYILYGCMQYCWFGEKIDFGEVFGRSDLNRIMGGYYRQIDDVSSYQENLGKNNIAQGNQSYDNDAIKELAAAGYTQKEICEELGYDVSKSRSLSSNKGYREGRQIFLELPKKQQQSSASRMKKLEKSEIRKTDKTDKFLTKTESELIKNESEIVRNDGGNEVRTDKKLTTSESELSKNCQKTDETDKKKLETFNF